MTAARNALHQVFAFAPGADEAGPELPHLLLQQRYVAARRQGYDVEVLRQ